MRADIVEALEQEMTLYAHATQSRPREALHDLWEEVAAGAFCEWPTGGFDGFHEATILLAFLCQLSQQGWSFAQGIPQSRQEIAEVCLRVLRRDNEAARSPRRRGLGEQRSEQSPDALRVLSSILARHAQAAWPDAAYTYAPAFSPLASAVPGRAGMLRAAGNAIVPQLAAEFITAFRDV